jgi:hypothetical protein
VPANRGWPLGSQRVGGIGSGRTPSCAANTRQAYRPAAMPAGSPIRSAMAVMVVACHATAACTCDLVNPSAFRMARSRRLRRVELTSMWASVPTASSASSPDRRTGTSAMRARLITFPGRSEAWTTRTGRLTAGRHDRSQLAHDDYPRYAALGVASAGILLPNLPVSGHWPRSAPSQGRS